MSTTLAVWLLCGFIGWFMTIQDISRYKTPSYYDAAMIIPGVASGPIMLIISVCLR
jgi:hypothetical protein